MLADKSNSNSGFISSNCNSDSNSNTDLPANGLRATRNAKREAVNQMSVDDTDSSDSEADNARKVWAVFPNGNSSGSDEENNNASSGKRPVKYKLNKFFTTVLLDQIKFLSCMYFSGRGRQTKKKNGRKLPGRPSKGAAAGSSAGSPFPMPTQRAPVRGKPRGRVKKAKPKKAIKITGLDLLHSQTLLSTSPQAAGGKKLPPARGCVDQQLTSLAVIGPTLVHEELEIPAAPADTPYALQILLDMFRTQYMQAVENMKSSTYRMQVQDQIDREKVCFSVTLVFFLRHCECVYY